jgi:hypothetical protein
MFGYAPRKTISARLLTVKVLRTVRFNASPEIQRCLEIASGSLLFFVLECSAIPESNDLPRNRYAGCCTLLGTPSKTANLAAAGRRRANMGCFLAARRRRHGKGAGSEAITAAGRDMSMGAPADHPSPATLRMFSLIGPGVIRTCPKAFAFGANIESNRRAVAAEASKRFSAPDSQVSAREFRFTIEALK